MPLLLLFSFLANSQIIELSFEGSGSTVLVDSVLVSNITQGVSVSFDGDDTLKLYENIGVKQFESELSEIKAYPNPTQNDVNVSFYYPTKSVSVISVWTITGKQVVKNEMLLLPGMNTVMVSGLNSGIYLVNVKSNIRSQSVKIVVANGNSSTKPVIKSIFVEDVPDFSTMRMRNADLPYVQGDSLQIIGYSLIFKDTLLIQPTKDSVVEFVFGTFPFCPLSFIDLRDSNIYSVAQLGDQCWMAENLAYLPLVYHPNNESDSFPVYYVHGYYGYDVNAAKATFNYKNYGVLYNWPAAMNGDSSSYMNPSGRQGVCPLGWHLPSDDEWKELEMYLGMSQTDADDIGNRGEQASVMAGQLMLWDIQSCLLCVDSAFGFSGLDLIAGGYRAWDGEFYSLGSLGYLWTTSMYPNKSIWNRGLHKVQLSVKRNVGYRDYGYSVRCVRD